MRLATLFLVASLSIFAADDASHDAHEDLTVSKWVHTGILAAGLGFLWMKVGAPAIKARGEGIRRELEEARKLKADSDVRVAQIQQRLGNLSGEIDGFRDESKRLLAAETAKLRTETEKLLARVQSQAENEIASLTKAARLEVKAEAARLALQLAEQKIAAGIPAETHASLVQDFVDDLRKVQA